MSIGIALATIAGGFLFPFAIRMMWGKWLMNGALSEVGWQQHLLLGQFGQLIMVFQNQ